MRESGMRCDLLLSRLCLFRTRSQAGRACDEGRVRVNGRVAKAACEIRPGDRILWTDPLGRHEEEVEILSVPAGSVSRAAARDLYRRVGGRALPGPWDEEDGPTGGGTP
jgi:ribosomal 50S subunit-recycling heat shock protein